METSALTLSASPTLVNDLKSNTEEIYNKIAEDEPAMDESEDPEDPGPCNCCGKVLPFYFHSHLIFTWG